MLEIIIGGYAAIIWLVFIKFKLLPWNIKSQLGAVAGALFLAASIIFTVNVITPVSEDVRVINMVSEVTTRVPGTVKRVAVEGNVMLKKGDVLVEIDETPYRLKVNQLKAQLADVQANASNLKQDLELAKNNTVAAKAQLDLMNLRLEESTKLANAGAGNQYDVESYRTEVQKALAAFNTSKANEVKANSKLTAMVGDDNASVANVKAQLEAAQYDLDSCIVRAPADGFAVNVVVRPGNYAVAMPLRPLMSFVENEQRIIAFFDQNELRLVKPGDKAEIAMRTIPGKVLYAKVDSIIWANGGGQSVQSGVIPNTPMEHLHAPLPQKYAVKLKLNHEDPEDAPYLAMGARGVGAVYTEHIKPLHLLRMVVLRLDAKINYLIFKLP